MIFLYMPEVSDVYPENDNRNLIWLFRYHLEALHAPDILME